MRLSRHQPDSPFPADGLVRCHLCRTPADGLEMCVACRKPTCAGCLGEGPGQNVCMECDGALDQPRRHPSLDDLIRSGLLRKGIA